MSKPCSAGTVSHRSAPSLGSRRSRPSTVALQASCQIDRISGRASPLKPNIDDRAAINCQRHSNSLNARAASSSPLSGWTGITSNGWRRSSFPARRVRSASSSSSRTEKAWMWKRPWLIVSMRLDSRIFRFCTCTATSKSLGGNTRCTTASKSKWSATVDGAGKVTAATARVRKLTVCPLLAACRDADTCAALCIQAMTCPPNVLCMWFVCSGSTNSVILMVAWLMGMLLGSSSAGPWDASGVASSSSFMNCDDSRRTASSSLMNCDDSRFRTALCVLNMVIAQRSSTEVHTKGGQRGRMSPTFIVT
mmetsp:Transcript_110509/g.276707  ORF Transcript_110509/g.276707 Transcript_110509/m.276707 type:complete len:307 (-) Transcript_110509:383-1303(-)